MFRLAVILIVVGGFVGYFGYQEYQVGSGASSDAVKCELADLETGTAPPDKHLQIGQHWAIYPTWVGWGDQDSDQIDYIYYPIVSEQHPYNQAWDRLLAQYGDAEIPESQYPQLTSLAVLVKTDRYPRENLIPQEWQQVPSITGLLIHEIEDLKTEEEQFLRESYPGLAVENVMILEEGREPKSPQTAMAIMFGGVVLLLGGVAAGVRSVQG